MKMIRVLMQLPGPLKAKLDAVSVDYRTHHQSHLKSQRYSALSHYRFKSFDSLIEPIQAYADCYGR